MNKPDDKTEQHVDISVPEEFALRDEVRWLKSEDLKLFRATRELFYPGKQKLSDEEPNGAAD